MVGANGANGSLVSAALDSFRSRRSAERYGATSLALFDQAKFPSATQIVQGGWDVRGALTGSLEPGKTKRGYLSPQDVRLGDEELGYCELRLEDVVGEIRSDIVRFNRQAGADHTVVVYIGSPATSRCGLRKTLPDLMARRLADVPSSCAYALGALLSEASFVDFTPSTTLEYVAVREAADSSGQQVAGRDGTTGQTYLKLAIADALARRGIRVKSWYSTNVLGNRDGEVLALPGASSTKIYDKTFALNAMFGLSEENHQVDIRFVPEFGDKKEAWDSVLLEGFLDEEIELRLNWKAADSPLAAQSILDLVRLLYAGSREGLVGLRADLGFFFKHPLGCSDLSSSSLFTKMLEANAFAIKRSGE